jgi:hypothetical protein
MAIDSYSTLKTAIGNYTHRGDLTSYYDEFIDMAEAAMNRHLRVSEMETSTAVAVTTADLSLPAGFLEMRDIHVSGSPDYTLEYLAPYQLEARKQTGETGRPKYYTITANAIELYPVGSYTIEMVYYKGITPLDDTNTSNFVLSANPDAYLHGALHYAYVFVHDDARASLHGGEFAGILAKMSSNGKAKKFSGAPLQVRVA